MASFQYSQVIKPTEGLLQFHSKPNKFSKFNAPFRVVSDDVRFMALFKKKQMNSLCGDHVSTSPFMAKCQVLNLLMDLHEIQWKNSLQ